MNVGSLFSGIGGIDLGLERAGMRVVFQCEADEWRRSVLREHWPDVPCYEDVCKVAEGARPGRLRAVGGNGSSPDVGCSGARASDSDNRPDLLCGGFPCQDLSVAGRRRGLAGERSGLFFEFARVADAVLSDGGFVLIENVPGLLSSHGGRDFAVLLSTLAELGFYDLAWRVLDSRYFGVPQRRRRVFILGRRARGRSCAEILLEPESGGGDSQAGREARAAVAGTLGGGAGERGWAQDTERMTFIPTTALTLMSHGGNDKQDPSLQQYVAAPLSHGSNPNSNMAGRRREDDVNLAVVPSLTASNDPSRSPQSSEVTQQVEAVLEATSAVRRLTPTECERLQSFPDGWTAYGSDSRRYAALGDAVTVNVAHWIGRRILAHIERSAHAA